jgi:hypothetical protein
MNWDRLTAQAEAEVCLFRLVATLLDGMAGFTAFATAQGFTVAEDACNPANPFVAGDGTLRGTCELVLAPERPEIPHQGPDPHPERRSLRHEP